MIMQSPVIIGPAEVMQIDVEPSVARDQPPSPKIRPVLVVSDDEIRSAAKAIQDHPSPPCVGADARADVWIMIGG
ncbi:hypothetical protein A0U93_10130 [Neoasaia chiangmaiensis]|uniref:Uncharacterized protein n=1 Tax=Neoasaia chiangmaiensis TaxID=320497 RepID=A0A1U9KR14_9PROT|nr:hypothetical protein A0U93_10130 [Neoasaia chiangmaiensis]